MCAVARRVGPIGLLGGVSAISLYGCLAVLGAGLGAFLRGLGLVAELVV